jgi:cathepsin B
LACLFFACVVALATAQSWTNCGTASDKFQISSLTFNPNPVLVGQNLNVQLSGSLSSPITSGNVAVSVSYLGLKVLDKTFSACDLLGQAGYSCPVPAGPVNAQLSELIPSYAPKGKYTGQIKITDQTGAEVACVSFSVQLSSSAVDPLDTLVITDEIVNTINSDPTSTWVATKNNRFSGMTRREVKKFIGALTVPEGYVSEYLVNVVPEAVPTSFDARQQWPTCIHPIRDQQQCGSCWAFGATEAFSDRICIQTNGATNVILSPEHLVSCDTTDYGCQGGFLENAWRFMQNPGVVVDSCFPYTAGSGYAPACRSTCVNGAAWKTYKVGQIYAANNVAAIQALIYQSGPVEGSFTVYQDLFSYSSGVYQHRTGALDGGHAIKIVGWGVTSTGVPYWIIANSWSTSWGMSGFFWMLRGSNECGIESNIVAGTYAP